jgi:antagonist of KipI
MASMTISRPGLLTTVQDLGRWGYQSRGVPVSGAMDRRAHRLANRLVGNEDSDATLEVTLLGPEITFAGDTVVAVAGGLFDLTIDAAPIAANTRVAVRSGSVLKWGSRRQGARAYLAIEGGVDVPQVFGSRSTHVVTGMGGLSGRPLRAGDRLSTVAGRTPDRHLRFPSAVGQPPMPKGGAVLRMISGEPHLFDQLTGGEFRVSSRSDRMGYRLEGSTVQSAGGETISAAVATGAVQVTPTGQPILLMADHATTGGYPVAGVVIAADVSAAAQVAPGDWLRFVPCSLAEADAALREQEAALAAG